MVTDNIQLSQAIVTIAEATARASTFPGVRIVPSETEEWTYDISTLVAGYDRHDVALEHLVVEAASVVTELQSRFGEHGEGLGDLVLTASVNTRPSN